MAFGLGRLRLSSDQFWALTPLELAAAARALAPAVPETLGAARLAALQGQFPD